MPFLKRYDPLATPLLATVYGGIGLLEALPLLCSGGSVPIFLVLWILYSTESIMISKKMIRVRTEHSALAKMSDQEWEAESSWASLKLGIIYPMIIGTLPFINKGMFDYFSSSISHLLF